jgi:hypothetical protein
VGVTGGVTFDGVTTFVDATFSWASFQSVTFSEGVNFSGATFSREAIFVDATFSKGAAFSETKFSSVRFERATFSHTVLFNSVVCSGTAVFTDVTFGGPSIFVNAETGMTSFENATFETEPPRFSGAKLHEGTIWRGIKKWPTPKKADNAGAFVDAYGRLKLEMNRLQKHEDELDFFALELQSRRVEQGLVRGLPIALYGVLSDYGRRYVWPFVWLFAVAAFGAAMFRHFGALTVGEASGLSAANTFNVFGFRKDFVGLSVITHLSPWLEMVAALQTILGTVLLFLFGLGIRNKFRMK